MGVTQVVTPVVTPVVIPVVSVYVTQLWLIGRRHIPKAVNEIKEKRDCFWGLMGLMEGTWN